MTELGKEYGTALFMLAAEECQVEEVATGLSVIVFAFKENPDYFEFLSSPSISLNDRLASLSDIFLEIIPTFVLSFLQLMCEKGRINCFFDSAEEYKRLFNALNNISSIKVTSAVELTEEEKNKLKDKFESTYKNKVNIQFYIDESLLGGIVAEIDGKIIDGSLRNSLREIKEVMNK